MLSKTRSLALSLWLVRLLLTTAAAFAFVAPYAARWYDTVSGRPPVFAALTVTLYLALLPAFAALLSLRSLLRSIRDGEVFTARNAGCLHLLSYCCFAEAFIFIGFGFIRPTSFAIGFAAGFFGLMMRVLKNVFDKAVQLREDNDGVI